MTAPCDAAPAPLAIHLRPVRPADAEAMQRFVTGLSAESRRCRFHGAVNACAPGMLRHLTEVDGTRHVALVACVAGADDTSEEIVGEARYALVPAGNSAGRDAEFAIAVADRCRGQGIADELLRALLRAAAAAGVGQVHGDVLDSNRRMGAFMRRHGFEIDPFCDADPGATRWLRAPAPHDRRRSLRGGIALIGAWLGWSAQARAA